jgi:hypothetical protein
MAFGNIATFFFPTASNAGASLWGSDVRKLLDVQDTGNDDTTQTNHGTGGFVTRTLDPYTNNGSNLNEANYGWAVTPSDMNSVSGARRFIRAGDHTITLRASSNQIMLSPEATYTAYIYRVGPAPDRTRTLLGSGSSATINTGLANTTVTVQWSVNMPEIVFAPDETIQYSLEVNCAGVAISGRILRHNMGTQGGVAIRVDHPGLETLASCVGTASGAGAASARGSIVLGTVGNASGAGAALGVGASTAGGVGTAGGSATAPAVGSSVAGCVGQSQGVAQAVAQGSAVIGTVGTITVGGDGGDTIKRPIYIFAEDE